MMILHFFIYQVYFIKAKVFPRYVFIFWNWIKQTNPKCLISYISTIEHTNDMLHEELLKLVHFLLTMGTDKAATWRRGCVTLLCWMAAKGGEGKILATRWYTKRGRGEPGEAEGGCKVRKKSNYISRNQPTYV